MSVFMQRKLLALVAVLGLLLPAAGIAAPEASGQGRRGIVIGEIGIDAPDMFGASVRWDRKELKGGKVNSLTLSLVAARGEEGRPVFMREVPATAKRPARDYVLSLNPVEQALVQEADGLGVMATQKVDLDGGLFDRAWVAGSGDLPVGPSVRSRCSPIQPGGSYSGCYYGYSDLSNMDLHSATFTDAQFPFSTLTGANFRMANLSYAQMGYANLSNANLSNANLTGAYLYGANLKGANLTGATLTNAQYCNTVMPDGTVNNANC